MDEGDQVFQGGDSRPLVVIEFPTFRDFIDSYSPIISEEGIFIRNADVSESNAFSVADRVDFEVRLKDDFRLIQGVGEVVWLGPCEAAEGATGTAVRFHEIDDPSQRLISRLVANYIRDGGKRFEVGEPAAGVEGPVETEIEPEPEAPEGFGEISAGERLTAETLQASEAEALFASDGEEEPAAQLEFESVAPEEVDDRRREDEALDAPGIEASDDERVGLDEPVGLDTIAIPPGLAASLVAEGAKAEGAGGLDAGDGEREPEDNGWAGAEEPSQRVVSEGSPLEQDVELPSTADSVPGAEEALRAAEQSIAEGVPVQVDAPAEDDLEHDGSESDALASDTDASVRPEMSDDVVQAAEELSGVHRYDLPEPEEEVSAVTYAGSASVRPERSSGGRLAALTVAFLLLGAGAFYFGDRILSFLGVGGATEGSASTEEVEEPVAPLGGEGVDAEPATGVPGGQEAEVASADNATVAMESAATESEAQTDPVAAARSVAVTSESGSQPAVSQMAVPGGLRRVERITWREDGASTLVTIQLASAVSKTDLEVVRVGQGAPREVIKIKGIDTAYSPNVVEVGSAHVSRLRTGLHRTETGSALHVVADLTGAGVSILSVEPKGREIEITFG